MLVRGERLADTLSDYLLKKIVASGNVRVVTNCEVTALEGDRYLDGIAVRDGRSGADPRLPTRHLFVCIGGLSNTEWARDTPIARDSAGYLLTRLDALLLDRRGGPCPLQRAPYYLETSVQGSFAIGDVRHGSIKRVATAVSEGAMAVAFIRRWLNHA